MRHKRKGQGIFCSAACRAERVLIDPKIVCGVAGYARIYPDSLLVLFGQDAL